MPELNVPGGERGEAAITALGAQLGNVAAHYHRTEAELRDILRRDKSLRLDSRGQLHYLCDGLVVPVVSGQTNLTGPAAAALFPLSETFRLHSRSNSNRKIYLDFDGHTLAGNAWTANYNGGTNIVAPPWDTDGNPGSFSTAEQTAIQQIWFRVAEDYAPFNVDVTTEYPGEAALTRSNAGDQNYGTRALVSAISSYFGNYGGLAYVGAFDSVGDYNKPALIFPERLGNNEKNIAEAISHEVGHNLGLSHDGIAGGAEYYTGQGNWAPIMGVGYSKPIVQWSRGEYANPSNTEDDYSLIGQNGLSYRADDHGNGLATATALIGWTNLVVGIIERTNDVDFFSFQTGGGTAQFTITPWELGANVHFLMGVYDSAGTLLTNREVSDTAGGVQPVTIGVVLNSGLHYLGIEGIGSGNPLTTGYSEYGSLGNYTLAVNLPVASQWLPTAGGTLSWTNPANWLSGAVPNTVDAVANINNNITGNQVITLDTPVTIGTLVLGDTNATHGFTLATGATGAAGALTLDVLSGPAAVFKSRGTNDLIAVGLLLMDDLVVSNSSAARLTFGGSISGSRSVTKTGSGVVALAGTNTYAGDTVIIGGTLALDATLVFSGAMGFDVRSNAVLNTSALGGGLVLNNAQRLGGNGTVVGAVTCAAGSSLFPGPTNTAGTLTFSNELTLAGGATWRIDLASTNTVGGGVNDLVIVAGDLALAGTNTIQLNLLNGVLVSPGTYTILTYGGALLGGASNLVATSFSRQSVAVDGSVPGEIRLNISASPADLTWRGDGSLNRWDTNSFNWRNAGVGDKFYPLDKVSFDDSGSNNTYINLLTPLPPTSVVVSAAKNFTWGGVGRITGAASLTKLGVGTLTISNANDFSGSTLIGGGVLKVANSNALGAAAGVTIITNTGGLDVNGINLGAEQIIMSGVGGGSGAVFNAGAPQTNALRFVTLAGDSMFGGSGRWDIRANPTGSFAGNNFKLTKTSANEVWLADLGETTLGDIEVREGILGIQGTTTLGNPARTLTVASGATLGLSGTGANILAKHLAMTNGNIAVSVGSNTFTGNVELSLTNKFQIDSQFAIGGFVSGSGSILKSGSGTLVLTGVNTLSGHLLVDTASALADEGVVRIAGNQVLQQVASPVLIRNNDRGSSTLQLEAGVVVTQAVQLAGRNVPVPTVQSVSGSNNLAGGVSLENGGSNYWFQSDSGALNLGGSIPASTPGGSRILSFLGAGDFVISGTLTDGFGGGTVGVIKSGPGTLILDNSNTFTSGTILIAGEIRANATAAFGLGAVTANPGTNLARLILGPGVTVSNNIVAETINPGAALGFMTCADDGSATFAGSITLNANAASGGHFAGPIGGNILNITGPITAPATNCLVVRRGDVRLSGGGSYAEIQTHAGTTSLGADNGLATNAVLDLGGNGHPQSPTIFDLNGFDQALAGLKNAVAPDNVAWVTNSAAPMNTLTLDLGTNSHSFGGSIVGTVALRLNSGIQILTKSGASDLNGHFIFEGNAIINGGVLVLATGITLSNTPVIELAATGTLDASAGGLVLESSQTLQGDGTVLGNITTAGVIQPGTSIGILTCSNDVVLGATSQTWMEISRAPVTNDLLRVSGALTYCGSLIVTNLIGTLTAGDEFKLFAAASYGGNFDSTNLPPLGAGLDWQFTPDDGTLRVMGVVATNPINLEVATVGNALQLTWPTDHLGWRLEAQTNTLAGGIGTNWFDVPDSAETNLIIVPLDVLNDSVFFRLIYP